MTKAILYDIEITDSVMSMIHGYYFKIKEIYFPEQGISVNLSGNQGFNIIKDKTRYKKGQNKKDIDVPTSLGQLLLSHSEKERKLKVSLRDYLK